MPSFVDRVSRFAIARGIAGDFHSFCTEVLEMKKLILVLAVGVVGLVGPRNIYYGGQVAYTKARDFMGSRVSGEFKLEVAKKRLVDERKKLEESERLLAKLYVQSENQSEKVAKLDSKMEREKSRLFALRSELPEGDSKIVQVILGRQGEIAKELAEGLKAYASDSELLRAERDQASVLNNQVSTLEQAIGERKAMLATLDKSIVTLESRQATVRLRNGGTDLPSQDGLNEIEGLLQSITDNVAVEERLFEMRRSTIESPRSRQPVEILPSDAISEFDSLFSSSSSPLCDE